MSPRIQAPHVPRLEGNPSELQTSGIDLAYKEGWDDCKSACLAAIEALPKGKIDAKRVYVAIKATLPTK